VNEGSNMKAIAHSFTKYLDLSNLMVKNLKQHWAPLFSSLGSNF